MTTELEEHSSPLKMPQNPRKMALFAKIFFACGATKKEGALRARSVWRPPLYRAPPSLPRRASLTRAQEAITPQIGVRHVVMQLIADVTVESQLTHLASFTRVAQTTPERRARIMVSSAVVTPSSSIASASKRR